MEGKFSLKEFITGGGKTSWFKSWGYGWRLILTIGILVLVILGIKSIFLKSQTQRTQIGQVQGNVNIIQKSSRFLIPFAEVSVGQSNRYDKLETAIRCGIRVEF